tara:strand:+ start:2114 stop:2416 length:303 start_codon:yes stop_codon:yes gene_type:complete
MVLREAGKINVQGSVTTDNVVALTQQGADLFDGDQLVVDLEKVTEVDSSVIAMLLEWLRKAGNNGHSLQFINIPKSLESLIQLYGVSELIPRVISNNPVD